MYAENQAVLDEMARDKEECRINYKIAYEIQLWYVI